MNGKPRQIMEVQREEIGTSGRPRKTYTDSIEKTANKNGRRVTKLRKTAGESGLQSPESLEEMDQGKLGAVRNKE